jgi:divalent metal cation (Fe/Co/Zn/Cd) transporter
MASRLEEAIQAELGQDVLIDTHIEPRSDHIVKGSAISEKVGEQVAKFVRDAAGSVELITDVRDIRAEQGPDGLYLTLHCLFDKQVPLKRVHAATDRLETLLRTKGPEFDRIVIHAEPFQA